MADDRTRVAGNSTRAPVDGDSTRVSATPVTPVTPAGGGHGEFGATQRTAPGAVQVGEVLGHTYRIEAFLAKGGMGAVYRARHVVLESEHAIKIILSELSEDPQVIALLNQEARTLRTVKNDAVVEYQGLMLDEHGRRYLVMEFADGPSLAAVLKERRFTPAEVRALRDRLAAGFAAAHEKGIYHRDISPDNVILPGSRIENAKIIDFGIAKSTATGEKTLIGGDFAGKYSYASPEQAGMHGGKVDARSDIYSLGLVLASAAIGFGGKLDMGNSLGSVFEARQKVPDLSKVPAELRDEIAAMLQPKPEDRPQSMLQLIRGGTAQASDGGARQTKAASREPATTTGRQGSKALLITVAAVSFAVVVLLGAGYFVLFPPRSVSGPEVAASRAAPPLVIPPPEPSPLVATPPAPVAPSPAPTAPASSPGPQQQAAIIPPLRAVNAGELAAQVGRAVDGFQCAEVKPSLVGDQDVRLTGFVSSSDELSRLRAAASGVANVGRIDDSGVGIYPLSHCYLVKLVNQTAAPSSGLPAPRLQFNNPDLIYKGGDTLIVNVSGTSAYSGYLYVDYFDNEGNVVHMLPMQLHPDNRMKPGQVMTLGTQSQGGKPGERVYQIEAPFGPNLIVAIASPKPLFKRARANEQESAETYLPVLAEELKAAAADPAGRRVVASYTIFSTVPR
ncbi:MAG TPA: serine/threonine-protein kinase [Stellaceae bacterium]|nr:serine/threonine-protein kinase [Stellaceae bacterium]